ncbi:hypothetical protein [Acidocella sp.]|uniref:hypothetical protein n=1 Tax=Acidocella sp. TaxID=50710 RepID=UPI0026115E52|nr:hypothetical protein [Acidocella sp.]
MPIADHPSCSLRGVAKSYGGAVALARLDLTVRAGEFFTLLGPSGAEAARFARLAAEAFSRRFPLGRVPLGARVRAEIRSRLPEGAPPLEKRFDTVIPAAGAVNASLRMSPDRLAELVQGEWVRVTQEPGQA